MLQLDALPRDADACVLAEGDRLGLTRREREVALHASRGESNREIAERLGASPWTIKLHLASAYRKAAVSSRTELIRRLLGVS